MGADFTFRYYPANDEKYEVAETTSEFFISLFDADMELLKASNLFPPFVQQYREHIGQTSQEWMESSTEEEIQETILDIPDDPDDWDLDEMEWGPSAPFAAAEAKEWAQRWIHLIEQADDEILAAAFPYYLNVQTGKTMLQKQDAIETLQKVITQAEYAERSNLQITVEALWS